MPRHRDSGKGKAERAGGTLGMPGALKSKGSTEPEVPLLEETAWRAGSGHTPSERWAGGRKRSRETGRAWHYPSS